MCVCPSLRLQRWQRFRCKIETVNPEKGCAHLQSGSICCVQRCHSTVFVYKIHLRATTTCLYHHSGYVDAYALLLLAPLRNECRVRQKEEKRDKKKSFASAKDQHVEFGEEDLCTLSSMVCTTGTIRIDTNGKTVQGGDGANLWEFSLFPSFV